MMHTVKKGRVGRTAALPQDYVSFRISEIFTAIGEEHEQGFAPLPLEQLPGEGAAPFDIYLKTKLKNTLQPRFILCCPRGQVFLPEWRQKLQQMRISNIYFPAADVDAVLSYLQGRLEETLESPHRTNLEKVLLNYDVLQVWTRDFFAFSQTRRDEQIDLSLKSIDALLHLVRQDKINLGFIFDIRRYDRNRYTHSLNVCMLCLAFASYLGWDADKARGFGLGALLHDIGFTKVPPEVSQKKGLLTREERELVETHPTHGFRILKNFGSIGHDSLMMVAQHHENGDGSGYPHKLPLASIHTWALILRIIDTFEAMTAGRPWRLALPPPETLRIMRDDCQNSQIYHPTYLKAFIKFLGDKKPAK
jgi:HD-GYP domain-containing protein (c-di-GMP phosphodiesterase class II)